MAEKNIDTTTVAWRWREYLRPRTVFPFWSGWHFQNTEPDYGDEVQAQRLIVHPDDAEDGCKAMLNFEAQCILPVGHKEDHDYETPREITLAPPPADAAQPTDCVDCGRHYGNEYGFPDLVLPNEVWAAISPRGDEGGMLCPSCICKRLADRGFEDVPAVFRSGPCCVLAHHDTAPWISQYFRCQLERALVLIRRNVLPADLPNAESRLREAIRFLDTHPIEDAPPEEPSRHAPLPGQQGPAGNRTAAHGGPPSDAAQKEGK